MIFTSENSTSDNGMQVNSTVELVEGEDKTYWRTTVSVDHAKLYHSHHDARRLAEDARSTMHRVYLDVHSAA
jgi:beta-galactosidase beta subunit